MYRIDHWIDGRTVASSSGRSGKIFDPATGLWQPATAEHLERVLAAAMPLQPA
ncbi:MAG: methylmalonate-semialdehyde dehydrogenase (CoA acylating), partial [Actinobacteria bacterium]|nr:methylmalonate-semialdehyde dehydrogenase (CoA acylating) [Actinomycetota bacterium]